MRLQMCQQKNDSVGGRKCLRGNRRGMAALEFVIGFPFLLFIFAAIYAVSWAGVSRTNVIQNARYDVWKLRGDDVEHQLEPVTRNTNSKPLSIPIPTGVIMQSLDFNVNSKNTVNRNRMQGEISGIRSREFGSYRWMGGNRTAKAESGIIFWTWDHEEINQLNGPQPHVFQVIGAMTGLISGGLGEGGIGQDFDLSSPPSG